MRPPRSTSTILLHIAACISVAFVSIARCSDIFVYTTDSSTAKAGWDTTSVANTTYTYEYEVFSIVSQRRGLLAEVRNHIESTWLDMSASPNNMALDRPAFHGLLSGTKVYTKDGWKMIQHVVLGELLWTSRTECPHILEQDSSEYHCTMQHELQPVVQLFNWSDVDAASLIHMNIAPMPRAFLQHPSLISGCQLQFPLSSAEAFDFNSTETGHAYIISATEQTFFVVDCRCWKSAGQLRSGDILIGMDGQSFSVISLFTPSNTALSPSLLFTLSVAANHNFYISAQSDSYPSYTSHLDFSSHSRLDPACEAPLPSPLVSKAYFSILTHNLGEIGEYGTFARGLGTHVAKGHFPALGQYQYIKSLNIHFSYNSDSWFCICGCSACFSNSASGVSSSPTL